MDKTTFRAVTPPTTAECLKWFTEVQSPDEPMPSDVLWRMFVVMRHLAARILAHERALAAVVEESERQSERPN